MVLILILILILMPCIPLNAAAEIFAAGGYLVELKKAENAKGKRSLEPLYLRAQELCDELSDGSANLDNKDYQSAAARFRGLEVGTVEVPGAWIKPDFFHALAVKKGRKADIGFFAILRDEQHSRNWDIYVASHTDFIGCDTVGSGAFVKFYGRWSAFREKHPENYADSVAEALQEIEDALKQTSCVCGSESGALAELESFLKTFPETQAAEDLEDRIEKIKKKTSGIKFECKSS